MSQNQTTIAILVTDGFEQCEFVDPKQALEEAGAKVLVVSPKDSQVQGVHHAEAGDKFGVDLTVEQAMEMDFDALVLPGGVMNPDALRVNEQALTFVKQFFTHERPVAAICHGPQILINAEVVKGRKLTSFQSVRKDLENAGANWVDQAVVVDGQLITSRNPKDLPEFCEKIVATMVKQPSPQVA